MSELSADARALIDAARAEEAPLRSDKERIRRRLAAELGAGAFLGAALASATTDAAASVAASAQLGAGSTVSWLKGLTGWAALAGGAGVLYAVIAGTPAASERRGPATAPATAPTAAEPPSSAEAPAAPARPESEAATSMLQHEPSTEAVPAARNTPSRPKRTTASATRAPEIASTEQAPASLAAELALLARAQRALREGELEQALRIADEHARTFPEGVLAEERAGVETLARCLLARPGGQDAARAFLERSPHSPLAARVRKACGLR